MLIQVPDGVEAGTAPVDTLKYLFLATFSGPGLVWRKLASVWGGKVVLRCFK